MRVIRAHFDGTALVPDEPVDLRPGQRVILHVELVADKETGADGSLWDVMRRHAGSVEMPADWSAEHDHYLYGTPKQHGGN